VRKLQNSNQFDLDGTLYLEIDRKKLDNVEYLLLSNVEKPENVCIRKIVKKGDQEYLTKLRNTEFHDVLKHFLEKNENLFE
jgi:hypothetical protein